MAGVGGPVRLDAVPSLEDRLGGHHTHVHRLSLGVLRLEQQRVELGVELVGFHGDSGHRQLGPVTAGTHTQCTVAYI